MADKDITEAIVLTGKGIDYARYASLKGRLKLSKLGMKFKGASIRKALAAEFGLKPSAPWDDYIKHCQDKMDAILAEMSAARSSPEHDPITKHN